MYKKRAMNVFRIIFLACTTRLIPQTRLYRTFISQNLKKYPHKSGYFVQSKALHAAAGVSFLCGIQYCVHMNAPFLRALMYLFTCGQENAVRDLTLSRSLENILQYIWCVCKTEKSIIFAKYGFRWVR